MKGLVKYNIPIYGGELWVVFTDNFKKSLKKLKINIASPVDECDAFACRNTKKGAYCIFILNTAIRPDIICHEAIHVCNDLFYDRGVTLNIREDEHQAYMVQAIVNHVISAAMDCKKKIKIVSSKGFIELNYGKKVKR